MTQKSPPLNAVERGIKRGIDVIGAACGLALLSPLLAGAALAIRATMGSPVLFRHVRPGKHGAPFTMLKFRTMVPPKPDEVWFRSDAQRITPLGAFLRRTSIDELPELLNVLRGDMSLVGPRPLLLEYLPKYTAEENRRHDVLPGITGWAQVMGRQNIKFSERLALDVWYVDHQTLLLDLKILLMTIGHVLGTRDVVVGQDVDDVDDIGLSADRERTNGMSGT